MLPAEAGGSGGSGVGSEGGGSGEKGKESIAKQVLDLPKKLIMAPGAYYANMEELDKEITALIKIELSIITFTLAAFALILTAVGSYNNTEYYKARVHL